jgi:DNA-binding Lrp family transcriptional regulator
MSLATEPADLADPINARILSVSEDRIAGFTRDPIRELSRQTDLDGQTVIARLQAMMRAGTIRRVRQTLLATNLARGALVAWLVSPEKLQEAFDWMVHNDPFSGHVVIRSTDSQVQGGKYRLWTTLKVPQGYSLSRHCEHLCKQTGAECFIVMPAKRLFALGVGHVRRRGMEPGGKSDELAEAMEPKVVDLSDLEWRVLMSLKREFTPDEIGPNLWAARAREAGVSLDEFYRVAEELNRRGVIGRFSTFLEHVKPLADGQRVTRFNALFHWATPPGRESGPDFNNVNIMAVAHGTEKETVLAHKAAIDRHLAEVGIHIAYTNVFWGGRSEIKPSEIAPAEYRQWCAAQGVDPESMRG